MTRILLAIMLLQECRRQAREQLVQALRLDLGAGRNDHHPRVKFGYEPIQLNQLSRLRRRQFD
jgi:hypothetical protein